MPISNRTRIRIMLEARKRAEKNNAMEKIHISDTSDKMSDNFTMQEYYKPSLGGHGEFDMPICLYKAAQVVRDYYNIPITITSVFRPYATFGEHHTGAAIDLVIVIGML